jgi:hypothetical protein
LVIFGASGDLTARKLPVLDRVITVDQPVDVGGADIASTPPVRGR